MNHIPPGGRAIEPDFARQVRERSGVNLSRCYQCLTCTLGCPVLSVMDYYPDQIVRMIQLGAKYEVLHSAAIWRCASCETCVTRCPHEIALPRLMDALRQMALQEKVSGKETVIPAFHQAFLKSIRQWGRQYELGMLLEFKLKVKDLLSDTGLGMKMLRKRKLSLLPRKFPGQREVRAMWEKVRG
ncbi:MAG: 4Fe-4S dicluster domain-containing protein [Chloroflexota bacterium]